MNTISLNTPTPPSNKLTSNHNCKSTKDLPEANLNSLKSLIKINGYDVDIDKLSDILIKNI